LKKLLKLSIKALLLTALIVIPVSGAVLAENDTFDMVVAPNVINLESSGGSVHVHTNTAGIPADVALTVDGVLINDIYTFTDSCGNLVVKCSITTVKEIVKVGTEAEFVLTYSREGVSYTFTDTVPIIQVIPQKP
jgi:hypothetical protein